MRMLMISTKMQSPMVLFDANYKDYRFSSFSTGSISTWFESLHSSILSSYTSMASGSSFMGFGGYFIDAVAADWDMVSILGVLLPASVLRKQELRLLHNPDFFTSEGEPLSDDIFGPPLPSWDRLLSTTEPLPASPLEIPPATQYAPVVTQDFFLSPQIPHEAPVLRSCTTATPPRDLVRDHILFFFVGLGIEDVCFTAPYDLQQRSGWNRAALYRSHAAVRRRAPYSLTGVFYPARFLGLFSLLWPTQPAPSSSPVTVPPLNWTRVPQRDYNHGRRQRNFERTDPISFNVDGHPGINMGDALRKMFTGLDGRDDPVLRDAGGAISCRFLVGLLWFPIRFPSDLRS